MPETKNAVTTDTFTSSIYNFSTFRVVLATPSIALRHNPFELTKLISVHASSLFIVTTVPFNATHAVRHFLWTFSFNTMHSAKNPKDTNVRQSVQQLDSRQSDGWADRGGGKWQRLTPKVFWLLTRGQMLVILLLSQIFWFCPNRQGFHGQGAIKAFSKWALFSVQFISLPIGFWGIFVQYTAPFHTTF